MDVLNSLVALCRLLVSAIALVLDVVKMRRGKRE